MKETSALQGSITCLFTDMKGSTTLSGSADPQAWIEAASEHDRRMLACITQHGGTPERDEGDLWFAVFASATDAVKCAAAIKRAFPASGEKALRVAGSGQAAQVRIGVYTAQEDVFRTEQGNFRAHQVSLASRLMSAAEAGQALVSETAYNMARRHLHDAAWECFSNRYVRDFPGPVTLYALLERGENGQGCKAPLWAPEWLLREFGKFIGRDEYLGQIVQWLEGDRSLLLLHGQGGIGKTRLASQAVRLVGSHFEGHIYGVPLDLEFGLDSAKATPRRLAGVIASALGLPDGERNALADETACPDEAAVAKFLADLLKTRFRRQAFLLVLDNFESVHREDNVALLRQLLLNVPTLRCLVTSRLHFNLGPVSEAVPISGLRVPHSLAEDWETCDGYLLFVERARQNTPDCDLSDRDALRRILETTEGSALGIELVAARVGTPFLTLANIAAALNAHPLTTQAPDPSAFVYRADVPRHTSLERCFDWSYQLLPEAERELYPGLAVFPADFSPDAAQEIASVPVDMLRRWVLCYLVQEVTAISRALLSPALREFAASHLPRTADFSQTHVDLEHRFVAFYRAQAVANCEMRDEAQGRALRQERLNFHAAAQWATCSPKTADDADGLVWFGVALAALPIGDRAANQQQAIACYEAALRVYTQADFPQEWARTQNNLGTAYQSLPTGDRATNLQRAIDCYKAALRVFTQADFPQEWASTQNNLGAAYRDLPTGDRAANQLGAIAYYQAALRVRTEADFPQQWAMTQNNLGTAYRNLPTGDRATNLQRAIVCYEAAQCVYTQTDFPIEYGHSQVCMGNAYADLGETARAREHFLQAVQGYAAAGLPPEWEWRAVAERRLREL